MTLLLTFIPLDWPDKPVPEMLHAGLLLKLPIVLLMLCHIDVRDHVDEKYALRIDGKAFIETGRVYGARMACRAADWAWKRDLG